MNKKQLRYFALIPALLLVIGAGCGKTATNTNTVAVNDDTTNINTTANQNENINESANSITQEREANPVNKDVDDIEWVTYTDEKLGYSFEYPSDWYAEMNNRGDALIISNSEAYVTLNTKGEGSYDIYPISYVAASAPSIAEDIAPDDVPDEEALRYEGGRQAEPLIAETFFEINNLPTRKAFRRLRKGESMAGLSAAENTWLRYEYTYRDNNDLYYFWPTVVNDESENTAKILDAMAHSFKLLESSDS